MDDALESFVQTHEGIGDAEEALSQLASECSLFHEINSSPVAISDGMVDVKIILLKEALK